MLEFDHDKLKKLVKILNEDYLHQLDSYYKFQNVDDDDDSYEIEYIEYNLDEIYQTLKTKMQSYGYYYSIDAKVDDKVVNNFVDKIVDKVEV